MVELFLSLNGILIFLIQLKEDANSAEPKTAGITVEKLSDASKAYSKFVKFSFPMYCQFLRWELNNSNNHQLGAETRNKPIYFLGERVRREVPRLLTKEGKIPTEFEVHQETSLETKK